MNSFEYIEVSVRLEPFSEETAEMLMAELAELPYDSFVTEEPLLKAYIPLSEYRPGDLKVVLSGYPDVAGFEAVPIQGQNWNKEWESRFEPIVVDGKVTIKASFNENVPRTRFNIWIDPEMAFGTGSHNTTYMMMQRMLGIEDAIKGHVVLEVAARSAWGNARWNRVSRRVETACGDASLLQMGSYDVILANIHRNILLEDMPTYVRSLRHGGRLLMSGFYEADIPALQDRAAALGLTFVGQTLREEWACVEFAKN